MRKLTGVIQQVTIFCVLALPIGASETATIFAVGGDGIATCRNATHAEATYIRRPYASEVQIVSPDDSAMTNLGSGGLRIIVRGTPRFATNSSAVSAFVRAVEQWERVIQSRVTLYFDVDFGDSRFEQPWNSPALASTLSGSAYLVPVSTVTSALIATADDTSELATYASIPPLHIPTDRGPATLSLVSGAQMRALGLHPAVATSSDLAPNIAFNSAYTFDFDASDGISSGAYDFEGVAVHEIGHALGFESSVGYNTVAPAPLDFFRFTTSSVTMSTFVSTTRRISDGNEHAYFDGVTRAQFSSGIGGDGRQASHWKDDDLTSIRIGAMDPTIGPGFKQVLTPMDMLALDAVGWVIHVKGAPATISAGGSSSAVLTLQ